MKFGDDPLFRDPFYKSVFVKFYQDKFHKIVLGYLVFSSNESKLPILVINPRSSASVFSLKFSLKCISNECIHYDETLEKLHICMVSLNGTLTRNGLSSHKTLSWQKSLN